MNREKAFIKNSIILAIGTVIPKITSIVTLPIITGCLTKSEYGTYDLITILVSLVLPIATLQMQSAAFRYLIAVRGERKKQEEVITNIIVFTVPICIITLVILFFCLPEIDLLTRYLILIYFFIDIILATVRQIARGLSLNLFYSISAIVNSIIEMVLMVLFLSILNCGLHGALYALIISQLCSLLFLIIKSQVLTYINISVYSFPKIREMLSYSVPMIANSLSSWVLRVSDRFVLSWFMGIEANAIYAVANKLPNIFGIVQSTFSLAWQENATESVSDQDSGIYYGKMFDKIFNILVGFMALLIAFTPVIFRVLVRGEYDESYNHIPILCLSVMFSMISSYLGGIYIAHMKSREIGISTLIAALCNFMINVIFVKKIGIYAASLSTLISYLGLAIYRMINVQSFHKIQFNYIKIIFLIIVLAFMAALCFARHKYLDVVNSFFAIILAAFLNREFILSCKNYVLRTVIKH